MGMHEYEEKARWYMCRYLEIFQKMPYNTKVVIVDADSALYCKISLAEEYREEFVQNASDENTWNGLLYYGKTEDVSYGKLIELSDFQIDGMQPLKDAILMIFVSGRDDI